MFSTKKTKMALGALIALIFLVFTHADADTGKVVGVKDGDSIVVLEGNKQIEIRLQCIDAPEMGQAHGKTAKETLAQLVYGKNITIEKAGTDKYGRTLAYVYTPEGVNVNEEMVNRGYAWHYDKYCSSAKLRDLQKYAKQERKGIWTDVAPTPPWEFRQTKKESTAGQVFSNEDLDRYKPKQAPSSAFSPTPSPSSKPSVVSKGAFVGSINSNIYHYPHCEWAKRISPQNLVSFDSPEDAKRKGYRACKVCNPPQ